MTPVDSLAAMLRGEEALNDEPLSAALVDLAEAHGVHALLARTPAAARAPQAVAARLKELLAASEAICAVQDRELRRVVAGLDGVGIRAIVIKGGHLAHALYPSPALRPRADIDLVIAPAEQASVAAALAALGYSPALHVRGSLILGQCHYQRSDGLDILHAVDLHWRIASPLVFREVLPAAMLRASAVQIPPLGPAARGPSLPHALLIACVHLVAHHRGDPLLLWLHDMALLARALDTDAGGEFCEIAGRAHVRAVCAFALDRAMRCFPDPALADLADRVRPGNRDAAEPSARILTTTTRLDELWLDLRLSAGWRERVTLLREHLLPDADYMRATSGSRGWLPLAYARRAVGGARRWGAR
jgi:hypothetical protein